MQKRMHLLPLLLVFILLLSGCGEATKSGGNDTGSSETPENFAYTVLVTINPEIKLYMDENDKILTVEYLNDDAKTAYSDKEIVGLTLDDGLAGIVETAIEKEYLKNGKDITVELDDIKSDVVNKDAVLSSADSTIKTVLSEKKVTANVITKTDSETTAPISDAPSTTQPVTTQPETNAPTSNTEPIVTKCARCGGSGECQGCHGGKDKCPACSGTGYETCPMCDANGLDHGQTCATCGGSHTYLCTHCKGVGTAMDCPECNGSFKCIACDGTGVQQ